MKIKNAVLLYIICAVSLPVSCGSSANEEPGLIESDSPVELKTYQNENYTLKKLIDS